MPFRVEVRNVTRFFADIDAPTEETARTKALNLARSWKDGRGKPFNPHPVAGSVLRIYPKEEEQ